MNAPATVTLDEIHTFLGTIPAEEYERRAKLRSYRNAASALIACTESDTARTLAWQVIDWASPWIYRPDAPLEWLDQLNTLATRLMVTAMQAERMDDSLRGAASDE